LRKLEGQQGVPIGASCSNWRGTVITVLSIRNEALGQPDSSPKLALSHVASNSAIAQRSACAKSRRDGCTARIHSTEVMILGGAIRTMLSPIPCFHQVNSKRTKSELRPWSATDPSIHHRLHLCVRTDVIFWGAVL